MNYVFISPAYPVTCTQFCDRLHKHGVNVLGIGDVPYDTLNDQLKNALTEYYYVDTLEDYDQVYRAVAFFIHKYGRIDWLESLNEYWLPVDARLRSDFNIAVGTREDKIGNLVRKSCMKRLFALARTARRRSIVKTSSGPFTVNSRRNSMSWRNSCAVISALMTRFWTPTASLCLSPCALIRR